jgi:hypothetical protein
MTIWGVPQMGRSEHGVGVTWQADCNADSEAWNLAVYLVCRERMHKIATPLFFFQVGNWKWDSSTYSTSPIHLSKVLISVSY